MTEIPDDVMKAARNVAISLLYPEVDDDGRGYLTQEHIDLIARAILAERERCAKVAIKHAPATQDFSDAQLQDMAKRIAAAIRK